VSLPPHRQCRTGPLGHTRDVSDDLTPLDPARTTTLGEVLAGAVDLSRGWSVYLPMDDAALATSTRCLLVFDLWDDVEEEAAALG
jgi:hypothetical protein